MQADRQSNCLLAALVAWARAPRRVKLVFRRNRAGRWHVLWRDGGQLFEFYGRGASARGYLGNLLYRGCVRAVEDQVSVTVKNNSGLPVSVSESMQSDGTRRIDVLIEDAVERTLALIGGDDAR